MGETKESTSSFLHFQERKSFGNSDSNNLLQQTVVAVLPFKPLYFFKSVISYNLHLDFDPDRQPVSTSFLFLIGFITMRALLRKLVYKRSPRILPESVLSFGIPRKAFLTEDGEFDH
jgi:hypothetical protein